MKLTEILKHNQDVEWDLSSSDYKDATQKVGDRYVRVVFDRIPDANVPKVLRNYVKESESVWTISFISMSSENSLGGTWSLTGEGGQFDVFTFVSSAVSKWAKEVDNIGAVIIDVDKSEQKRLNLYLKMAQRLGKMLGIPNLKAAKGKGDSKYEELYLLPERQPS